MSMRQACRRPAVIAVLLAALAPVPLMGQGVDPVRYTVSFPAPHTHYVEVEATVPTGGRPQIEVMMPVWTPGSYLVREFARNVEAVTAAAPDRRALAGREDAQEPMARRDRRAPSITAPLPGLRREMAVRTNWVDVAFALLNGAPTFITLVERGCAAARGDGSSCPPGWTKTVTALAPASGGAAPLPRARLRHARGLADRGGQPRRPQFEVDGKPHELVERGRGGRLGRGARGAGPGDDRARNADAVGRAARTTGTCS